MPAPAQIAIKDSISTRLLVVVFSIYCVISIGVTFFHLVAEYATAKTRVVEEMEGVVQIFGQGISNAIWNADTEQLEFIAMGITNSPSVVGALIFVPLLEESIASGTLPTEEQQTTEPVEVTLSSLILDAHFIKHKALITHEEAEEPSIGSLTLYSNEQIVFNKVKGSFVIIIINAMVKTFALWIIFLWVSRILLGRPLLTLTNATHNLDLNKLENFKVDIKTKERNELKLLEESFNRMIARIYQSQNELKRQKENLEIQVQERTEELQTANHTMQEDLLLAAELQNAVLSEMQDIPFLKMSYRYFSYDLVSGDIYDMTINAKNEFCFFLGDATGHGVAAAFMTMMVEIGLDSVPHYFSGDKVLRQLNHLLASRNTGRFVTGIYLRISPEGTLYTSNAGHPSLLVIPVDGSDLVQMNEAGCPLGVFVEEHVPYVEEQYQLQDGDRVFVYTDGVTEWENLSNEQFGQQRLEEFLKENRTLEIDLLLENLTDHLKKFADDQVCNDDVTFHCFEFQKQ